MRSKVATPDVEEAIRRISDYVSEKIQPEMQKAWNHTVIHGSASLYVDENGDVRLLDELETQCPS